MDRRYKHTYWRCGYTQGMNGSTNLDVHHDFDEKKSGRSEKLLRDLTSTKGGMEVMNARQGQGSQRTVI